VRRVHAAQAPDLAALSRNQVETVEEGFGVDARVRPYRYVLDEVGKLLCPAAAAGILEVNEAYLASVPQPVGEVAVPMGEYRMQGGPVGFLRPATVEPGEYAVVAWRGSGSSDPARQAAASWRMRPLTYCGASPNPAWSTACRTGDGIA